MWQRGRDGDGNIYRVGSDTECMGAGAVIRRKGRRWECTAWLREGRWVFLGDSPRHAADYARNMIAAERDGLDRLLMQGIPPESPWESVHMGGFRARFGDWTVHVNRDGSGHIKSVGGLSFRQRGTLDCPCEALKTLRRMVEGCAMVPAEVHDLLACDLPEG